MGITIDDPTVRTNIKEICNIGKKINEIINNDEIIISLGIKDQETCDSKYYELYEKLDELKKMRTNDRDEELEKQIDLLTMYIDKISDLSDLYDKVNKEIKNTADSVIIQVKEKREQNQNETEEQDLIEALNSVDNPNELRKKADEISVRIFNVPLLVALLTRDPADVMKAMNDDYLEPDMRKKISIYIDALKVQINNNMILSDKALLDILEHVTGKNIIEQQRRNEKRPSDYNEKYSGQLLKETDKGYRVAEGNRRDNISTIGQKIVRFGRSTSFNRKSNDMLIRNLPAVPADKIMYRSFSSLPDGKKQDVISAIIYNLELCKEIYDSYYNSNIGFRPPVLVNLTDGSSFGVSFNDANLPHVLGIPRADYLPTETLRLLGLVAGANYSARSVLEAILKKKDEIIDKCGLFRDGDVDYEILPWEKIILKTNAFIRGDFFKTSSLVSSINPNSFVISAIDDIVKVSLTPTKFSNSVFNQQVLNPNTSFSDAVKEILKNREPYSDLIIKGMMKVDGIYIPVTNESAMGERIIAKNYGKIKTLDKYRFLLSGVPTSGSGGGFVSSVETVSPPVGGNGPGGNDLSGSGVISREFSVEEMVTSLVDIALGVGNNEECKERMMEYLEQIAFTSELRKQTSGLKK